MNLKIPTALVKSGYVRHLLSLGFVLATVAPICGDETLVDLTPNFDVNRVVASDATVQLTARGERTVLRVETGATKSWPGITITAPRGFWDLRRFGQIELSVRNTGTHSVTVTCRVDNPNADGVRHCVTGNAVVSPGSSQTLRVPLDRARGDTLDKKLFGMRGYPVAVGGDQTIDPRQVTRLLIFVNKPARAHGFEVSDIRASGTWTSPTAWTSDAVPYFPMIDTFGQYRHKDWPGKVHSLDELGERRDAEVAQLANDAGPENWDQYGGWAAGPRLSATGFFRVEKHDGKWWLVDPEGRLFWSHGIDCVRMLDYTAVEQREDWFEDFPGNRHEFEEFHLVGGRSLKGHFAGQSPRLFSFAGANLKRKYGSGWKQDVAAIIHQRLRHWGLNTIGNWSDEEVRMLRCTPYTDTISSRGAPVIEASEGYWAKFPDVFDPGFEQTIQNNLARRVGSSANDPWCIGYFSDNEMSWGDDQSLSLAVLRSPPTQAAKKVLVGDLRTKYGDIDMLNAAWGSKYESWDTLLQSRQAPDEQTSRADLVAFYSKAAEQYFRAVRQAIHAVAPQQLYLGCRFAWVNDLAAIAAGKYCDVVSYNRYQRSVADFHFPGEDRPLMIGEFHFGALDRGMFHTGLVPVESQAARAEAYQDYVADALRHPQFVGTHWFQYQDEPTTGRFLDEENYQIGFVDIADTPYPETIAASRRVGEILYPTRLGSSLGN